MRAFLDTSVLIATFYGDHQHHEPSKNLFLRFDKTEVCCAAHSLAEVYSTLTGMPGTHRVTGDEALLFLGNIRERLTTVALNSNEYFRAVEASSANGLAGGTIYDALLGHCALKAEAQSLYTWNLKDFKRLGPEIAARAKTP
jgi:predicted nucleic acid-binding protein